MGYSQAEYAQVAQQYAGQVDAQERDLSRISSIAIRQTREIDEITSGLRVLADQIYGNDPPPPPSQMPESGNNIRPVPALMEAVSQSQTELDRAIQSLRMAAQRFGRL
jgi:hypothetical protein